MDRINRIQSRSIKKSTKMNGLELVLTMIDLTTLEGQDTDNKVRQLCAKAQHLHQPYSDLPNVAAICVYPSMVSVAKKALGNSGIKVASVATAFPSGQSSLEVKLLDVKLALDNGADEIDMVISRGKFLQGEYNFVFDEIAAIKASCGNTRLKVILETGEIGNLDSIRKASDVAIYAGADFIKTSTGKIGKAATLPVTMERVQDHLGVDEEVSSFVLPIGATINMDGSALYQAVAAVFIAQAFGLDLSLAAQLGIISTATLASIGLSLIHI